MSSIEEGPTPFGATQTGTLRPAKVTGPRRRKEVLAVGRPSAEIGTFTRPAGKISEVGIALIVSINTTGLKRRREIEVGRRIAPTSLGSAVCQVGSPNGRQNGVLGLHAAKRRRLGATRVTL